MKWSQVPSLHINPEEARPRPNDPGHPSVRMLSHGSMEVRWYRPQGEAKHHPHDRDEVYVVVVGSARFRRGDETVPFGEGSIVWGERIVPVAAGHVLFVPAGTEHSFDQLSDDFEAWAVFFGPEGGERP